MLTTLWKDPERFKQTYFGRWPDIYYTGDYAVRDPDGYFWLLGRADEVLKVAGHRIGTVELESALVSHPAVSEAAVMGKEDAVKGEVPVAFVVLRSGFPTQRRVPRRTSKAHPHHYWSHRYSGCSRHRQQTAKDAKRQNHAQNPQSRPSWRTNRRRIHLEDELQSKTSKHI